MLVTIKVLQQLDLGRCRTLAEAVLGFLHSLHLPPLLGKIELATIVKHHEMMPTTYNKRLCRFFVSNMIFGFEDFGAHRSRPPKSPISGGAGLE